MKTLWITFTILFTSPIFANEDPSPAASADSCFEALSKYEGEWQEVLAPQPDSGVPQLAGMSLPFVRFSSASDSRITALGVWGHRRILLRRIRPTWNSTAQSGLFVHGDVLQFVRLVGPAAALFFGVQIVSPTEIWVPTSRELSAAIRTFNEGLDPQLQIPVFFQEVPASTLTSQWILEGYREGRIPWGQRGFTLISSVAHRLSAVLIPPLLRARDVEQLTFLQSLESVLRRHPDGMRAEARSQMTRDLLKALAMRASQFGRLFSNESEILRGNHIWRAENEEYAIGFLNAVHPLSQQQKEEIVAAFRASVFADGQVFEESAPISANYTQTLNEERIRWIQQRALHLLQTRSDFVLDALKGYNIDYQL